MRSDNSFENARQYIQNVLDSGPRPGDAHEAMGLMGHLLIKTGEIGEGIKYLDMAVALRPDSTEYLLWRADGLEKIKDYPAAKKDYQRLSELKPLNMQFKLDYARMLKLGKGPETALEFLAILQQKVPQFYPVYEDIASIIDKDVDLNLLISFYEDLVRANPYDVNHWIELIKLYKRAGRREESDWAVRKGRKIHPYFDTLLDIYLQAERQASASSGN